jgi:hypothetical protein
MWNRDIVENKKMLHKDLASLLKEGLFIAIPQWPPRRGCPSSLQR